MLWVIIGGIFIARNFDKRGDMLNMKAFVKQYILARGNREAAEILEDYVKYLHNLGYVIRRNSSQ